MRLQNLLFTLCLGNALCNVGCLSQVVPAHEPAASEEPAIRSLLAQHGFQSSGFVQVNRAPYVSNLDPEHDVTMFVSADAADAYTALTPENDTPGPPFPVGGIVVRVASDPDGALAALTVMVKREAGYFPESGDFFFGVTDVSGTPESDEHGPLWGALGECGQCHATRAKAGFLFGVAPSNR
jgi:hypothetical protein